jgi:hypothetical protein
MAVGLSAAQRVPDGPRAYRHRVRWYGALAGLAAPAIALLLAAFIGAGVDATGRSLAMKGGAVLVLVLFALPTAMLLGIPWEGGGGRYFLAVVTSIAVWLVIGAVAGHRATRSAVATWRDWWREYALIAAGLGAGVVVGLAIMAIALGFHP